MMKNQETPELTKINLNASIRVHRTIMRYPWAKLWYLCRAIDSEGSSNVIISIPKFEILTGRSETIFYEWLKKGTEVKAFRNSKKVEEHSEQIYLGGYPEICRQLKITDKNNVIYVPLRKVLGIASKP